MLDLLHRARLWWLAETNTGTHFRPYTTRGANFACATVARCIIVAGGHSTTSAEVYDEALNWWILLPCRLPGGYAHLAPMGSALL